MKDGGPAFPFDVLYPPHAGDQVVRDQYPGMTLRDWFAGQALAGAIAKHGTDCTQGWHDNVAERCYDYADAMLKARTLQS
jgi:hypothetical protein